MRQRKCLQTHHVFLVRKASGGWRPVIDLKNLNTHIHAPHFRMFTTSSVLSSVEKGDYAFKIDLQDAYFHVPIHPSSRKYLRFAFENRVYQFQVLPFGLNTAPQVFTRLGHTVTAYLHRQGVSVIPHLDDWLVHHPDRQILQPHQALLIDTLDLVGFILNQKKSELDLTQDLQFLGIHLRLDLGRALLPESKAGEIVACAHHLSSLKVLNYSQVSHLMGSLNWASGLIPLGRLYLRTLSTSFSFVRSDKPVYATAQIRPCGSCQPTAAMAGPTFSYLRNPDPPLSGGLHNLHGRLQSGLGRSHGGFQDFGYLDPYRPQAPHQLSGAQGGYLRPTALGSSASGPPGHDRHGQFDSGFIYQQAGRDSLHFPATLDCRAFPLVRVTRHSSPGETHSRLPERDSRPPTSSESANTDRVVPTPRDCESHLQVLGDTRSRHVCDTVELPPSSVHVSSSGARALAVDALSQDWQGRSMYMFPPFPEFMRKNQKPSQVNDPCYIPAIPTGKPEFGAPNCPVRALRYYHRYLTKHPELRKDRRHLFVPIKDNNAGKELSAPSISRWICTTIVDSHAAIQDSENLSGSVKAQEVRAVATSLQLFNKADLHSVMKVGRWSSGGTFTSFYLRDLCPQAESLQRAGPIVAAGDIVKISTF